MTAIHKLTTPQLSDRVIKARRNIVVDLQTARRNLRRQKKLMRIAYFEGRIKGLTRALKLIDGAVKDAR